MEEKIMIEDDIVDLTDLLEEGSPPSKPKDNSSRKRVNEPDSFDLGKEISMEYEVSVEEIEQGAAVPGPEKSMDNVVKMEMQADDFKAEAGKEPLLDIEKEIDLAIQDKFEDVRLTSKEEEMLLKDEPLEEPVPAEKEEKLEVEPQIETEPASTDLSPTSAAEGADAELESLLEDKPAADKVEDVELESLLEDKPVHDKIDPMSEIPAPAVGITETGLQEETPAPELQAAAPSLSISPEVVTGTLIEELKKEMPTLLESIMRPLVKELLQEVIVATRDALPSLVEKVIREEIEKLKKI